MAVEIGVQQKKWNQEVADYWSSAVETGTFSSSVYWLANPIVNRRYQMKAVRGREYSHWLDFCIDYYLRAKSPVDRILSVGCGDGSLERQLASLNICKTIDAIDIAPGMIEVAKQKAQEQGIDNIRYLVANVEEVGFPAKNYDAIFYNMSLHHMLNIEDIMRKTASVLNPEGFLFINEYIGPNRFDFSDREKEVLRALHALIPEKFRFSLAQHNFGHLQTNVYIPDPLEVARIDPSEAVCSAEIMPMLEQHFEIVEFNKIGGTTLQFLLQNIAGHFRQEDPDSMAILDLIYKIETTLINIGDLQSHFALIIAKPKIN